jgi:ribose 5-phosphate isomerase A
MPSQDDLKRAAARAAVALVPQDQVLGVGTGSTVDHFIDALAAAGVKVPAVVSSSERSSLRLAGLGFRVVDLNAGE